MDDILYVIQWWLPISIIGIIFYPLSSLVFNNFYDKGYLFSKVLGLGIIAYVVFVLNTFRILPLNLISIYAVIAAFAIVNIFIIRRQKKREKINRKVIIFEEILFLAGLAFWSFIRGHEPSINGLEKFMDFGFLNSILIIEYMPARDMWFTNSSINYYYFGHFTTAVLTKLS